MATLTWLQGQLSNGKSDGSVDTSSGVYTGAFAKDECTVPDQLTILVDAKGKVWAVMAGDRAVAFVTQKIPTESGPSYQQAYKDRRAIMPTKLFGVTPKGKGGR